MGVEIVIDYKEGGINGRFRVEISIIINYDILSYC